MGPSGQKRLTRRRSLRVDLQLPVVVSWVAHGRTPREEAMTLAVNEHGCLLGLKALVTEGLEMDLLNPSSKMVSRGKVVWCGDVSKEGRHQVAIELEKPDATFWGTRYLQAVHLRALSDTWVG